MAFCPKCGGEFVEGVTHCRNCDVDLVEEKPQSNVCASPVEMNRYLIGKEVVIIHVGYIASCREGQDLLAKYNIPTTIQAVDGGCNCHGQQQCALACEATRVAEVQKIYKDRWNDKLQGEGLCDNLGDQDVRLNGQPITCPGCGTTFTPVDIHAECPEGGLCLGL